MQPPFRLYGADHSAFSQKLLSYLRYKGLEHVYIPRTVENEAEFTRLARLPLIPLLVEADGRTAQDSTMIMDRLETAYPEPAARPESASLAYLSALLEDFSDEWVNKLVLHFRWCHEADRNAAAEAAAATVYPAGAPEGAAAVIASRMLGKLPVAGAGVENAPALEAAFQDLLSVLEAHLQGRAYLLGGTPCAGDFALAAQLQQMQKDSRAVAFLAAAPSVQAYLERMTAPAADGSGFEALEALAPTLEPLLSRQIGQIYLAFATANAAAHAAGSDVAMTILGQDFRQKAQRYAGRAFQELRRKRAAVMEEAALTALLAATGCEEALCPPVQVPGTEAMASRSDDSDDDDGGGEDD